MYIFINYYKVTKLTRGDTTLSNSSLVYSLCNLFDLKTAIAHAGKITMYLTDFFRIVLFKMD